MIGTNLDKYLINELNLLSSKINFTIINGNGVLNGGDVVDEQIEVNIKGFYIINKDDVFNLLLYLINCNLLTDGPIISGSMQTDISQVNLFLLKQKSDFRVVKYSSAAEKVFGQDKYTIFYQVIKVNNCSNYSNNKIK